MDETSSSIVSTQEMGDLVFASSQGLDILTNRLAELIGFPVLISNSSKEVLAASFSNYKFNIFKVKKEHPAEKEDRIFQCTILAESFRSKAVGQGIVYGGRIIGYLFVLFDQESFNFPIHIPVLDFAVSLFAVHLQGYLNVLQEKTNLKQAFLHDLLYGNIKYREEIFTKGEIWGWDFRQPFSIFYLLFYNSDGSRPAENSLDSFLKMVEKVFMDTFHQNPTIFTKRNEIVIFVPEIQGDKQKKFSFTQDILSQAKLTDLKDQIACGVGQSYDMATDLFRSYQEAKVSCDIGTLLGISIPFFSDLGLERILYKHDLQDLKEYYIHILGDLHRSDDEESSLFKILESFADHQFNLSSTAEANFMHRNTLRYQLKKIENILGRDLNNPNVQLDIIAAIKILRLHKLDIAVDIDLRNFLGAD